ncbi:hypothetical protein D4R87_01390 [bacterium]|nr:MAG: hypothetical protein D4R87_01390 [bacterium]
MVHVLEQLFDSKARVRIIRFFLRNPDHFFGMQEVAKRTKVASNTLTKEMKLLQLTEFIIEKDSQEQIGAKKTLKKTTKKLSKNAVFGLNESFKLLKDLRGLVFGEGFVDQDELESIINKVGKVKFATVSGVFLSADKEMPRQGRNRADLFIVVDDVDKAKLKTALQSIEAEIGKEVIYSVLSVDEFNYRRDMFDKFVYDILDSPREDIINKIRV